MKYGLTQFMFRDIRALKEKGHQVDLFTLKATPGLYNPLDEWRVFYLNWLHVLWHSLTFALRHPRSFWQLIHEAYKTSSIGNLIIAFSFFRRMQGSDVIYAYFGDHKLYVAYYCSKLTGIPLATTIRAYELYRNPNPRMLRHALQRCTAVATVSEYNRRKLIHEFGADADSVEVIRQIIDLHEYQDAPKLKILAVGFFAEKKGFDVLFEAIKRLDRHDIEVWIVGESAPDRNAVDCRQMADRLGISRQVAFFGQQRGVALRALFRECDIFCLPSRTDKFGDKEGFPNAIAEAMAFAKPVVSTIHAGIPEVVDATALVEENNPEALASALQRACDSSEWRKMHGQQNRQTVERLFSDDNNDRLIEMLTACAQGTPKSGQSSQDRRDPGSPGSKFEQLEAM